MAEVAVDLGSLWSSRLRADYLAIIDMLVDRLEQLIDAEGCNYIFNLRAGISYTDLDQAGALITAPMLVLGFGYRARPPEALAGGWTIRVARTDEIFYGYTKIGNLSSPDLSWVDAAVRSGVCHV